MSSYTILSFKGPDLPASYAAPVYAHWLRSYRYGNDYIKLIDSNSYYKNYKRFIWEILSRPECIVRLAVLTEDKDVVIGFSVSRETILDYVHVSKDLRCQGIAKSLVPENMEWISHLTKQALAIMGKKYVDWKWKFNPFN